MPSRTRKPDTGRIIGWILITAIVVILVVRGLSSILAYLEDLQGFIEAGEQVLQGADIYAPFRNTWPPVFSVLVVPVALLARIDPRLAGAVWLGLSLLVLYGVLQLTTRLVYRRAMSLTCRDSSRVCVASAAVVVPLVLALRSLIHNFANLQINVFILLFALAGCLLVTQRRGFAGGVLIGVAAAIKVVPIFFAPYFVWKRWWRSLAGLLTGLLVVSVAPVAVFGPAQWWDYMRRWREIAADVSGRVGVEQSIFGSVDRLVGHRLTAWTPDTRYLEASGQPEVALVVAAVVALLILAFMLVSRQGGRDVTSPAVTTELALVLVAIPLLTLTSHVAFYVFLLPAYAILWRAAVTPPSQARTDTQTVRAEPAEEQIGASYALSPSGRRTVRWLLAASFVFGSIAGSGLAGWRVAQNLKVLGAITVAGLLTAVALFVVRWEFGRRHSP